MIKLKEIIQQLNNKSYHEIEGKLKNKAEALTLFLARNNTEHKILNFLQFELKKNHLMHIS